MRRVRPATVCGSRSVRGRRRETLRSLKHRLHGRRTSSQSRRAARQRFNSNYTTTGLLRKFNARAGAFAQAAVDPHAVFGPIQNLQTFIYVADPNTLLEDVSELRF